MKIDEVVEIMCGMSPWFFSFGVTSSEHPGTQIYANICKYNDSFWILNGGSKTFASLPAVTSICFLWKGWQINTTRVTGVEGFVSTRHWAVTKVIIDEGIWNIALRLGTLKVRCPWDNLLIAQPYEFHLLTESFRQRQFPRAVVIGDRSWALCTARVRSVSNHLQRHS